LSFRGERDAPIIAELPKSVWIERIRLITAMLALARLLGLAMALRKYCAPRMLSWKTI
jgi:hypothetical protein